MVRASPKETREKSRRGLPQAALSIIISGLLRRATASYINVARVDWFHREIAHLVAEAEGRITGRRRIIIKKENAAQQVLVSAWFAVVLHRKVNGIYKIRIIGTSSRAPEKG